MPKKGENIYKRKDGRWEGRYIKNRNAQQKICYGYIYGKKYSEVKERLTLLKAKTLVAPKKIDTYQGTFEDWITYWLLNYRKNTIKSTTYYSYLRLINYHIIPVLGTKRLVELTREQIQLFINTLCVSGLSGGSIRNIYMVIKQSLKEAVNQEYLEKNPCQDILLPKIYKKKVKALTIQQQKRLEFQAFKENECSPIILALYTGMRIGEISALKWEDIDFEQNTIFVRRTLSRVLNESNSSVKTKLVSEIPKTKGSERVIPLPQHLKRYLIAKKKTASSTYVISCKGKPAETRVINYRFKKVLKELNFDKSIHFHALRHTFATRCIEKNVDIASLSRLLGHQSTKMTLDTYTDSMLEKRQEAMNLLDDMIRNEQ